MKHVPLPPSKTSHSFSIDQYSGNVSFRHFRYAIYGSNQKTSELLAIFSAKLNHKLNSYLVPITINKSAFRVS